MKKLTFIFFIAACCLSLSAQDYLTGKLIGDNSAEQQIFYDRTQNFISKGVYQTLYKVFDKNKSLIYSVSYVHERIKPYILITIKQKGGILSVDTVKYDRAKSGLIFSDQGNLDTSFNLSQPYRYLLSFTDTSRDYPIAHKIKVPDGKAVIFDPVTKVRLRKHNELSRYILANDPDFKKRAIDREVQAKKEKEMFNAQLLRLRDSVYLRNSILAERVGKIKSQIENDIAVLFNTKKVNGDAMRYEGEKVKGFAEGNGLFMSNGNYYDGYFRDGKFVSGSVIIHYDAYEYCGDYSLDSLNGIGWLKYKNESYLVGIFREGALVDGVTFSISKSGEVYFGNIKNGQRTGYGELYNTKGEMYYGEFINGRLVKGYSKDVDPFGFFSYSKIEKGIKTPVEIQQGEEFFNPLLIAKQ